MNNAWTVEYTRIVMILAVTLIIGISTEQWVFAILVPCASYIFWTLLQIHAFERWIRTGAPMSHAPNANGIWQLIVQHIHRSQKNNSRNQLELTQLLNQFESTISALPYATITLNKHMAIEWANEAALHTLGINRATDIGNRFDNLIREPRLSAITDANITEHSCQLVSPVDPSITLMISFVTFGQQQRLITAKDISQIISVQKLRKAFIANASHELRTPLTVISGYLEILSSDDSLPPAACRVLNNANEQALRMQSILTDLLTLSKLEEKNQVYPKDSGEPVALDYLLKHLIRDIKQTSPQCRVNLDVVEQLTVRGNESEMFSLCQNLLTNAVKYSPPNAKIDVNGTIGHNGTIQICVKDNGEGIANEHLERLTERFYRVNTQRSRSVGGTGLGLSIVKHILENHGGYLNIDSQIGVGSTFTAVLPAYRLVNGQALPAATQHIG